MRKLTGILFAIFMVFLFLEILVGFPIHLEHEPEPAPVEEVASGDPQSSTTTLKTETQQKATGVHLVESKKGDRDWELFSESAENSQGKGDWKLQNVRVLFYNNDRVDFIVTGKTGIINSENKNLRVEGDVVTKSSNGYIFQSQSVEYIASERIIKSPKAIKMIGPPDDRGKGMVLTGGQMLANVQDNTMVIKDKVNATKALNDGKTFQIQSGAAEFSNKNRMAKFTNDVAIDVGGMKMQGPEASFEYRPDADILQSVLVKGGVKVSDVDKYATSDSVKFDPEQNKFTFNGRPRVVQNNDEITGDQIVFIDGGKKVKVEKIKARVDKQ